MTHTLRIAILDALMERWRERWKQAGPTTLAYKRKHLSSCLDMILPVAEPMIREAALREAAGRANQLHGHPAQEVEAGILALGEPK